MKVSVAMVAYNHERFIRQALESVLAQRVNFDFQIIVGEDCSTDGTRAILMDLYRRYPDKIVPLLHDQNLGMMRNMQATLAECSGEYLALIEGDDYWLSPDKLQKQVDFLDQHPDYAICSHRAHILNYTGAGETGVTPRREAGTYTIEDVIADNFIPTCAVMYRWRSVKPLPNWFLDLKLGDLPLHILAARTGKIWLMDEVMGIYRMHDGGVWTSGRPVEQKVHLMQMFKAIDQHTDFEHATLIRQMLATCYFDMSIIERLNGNRMATLKYLVAAFHNGGLKLQGRWRALAALLAFSVLGYRRRTPIVGELSAI